MNNRLDQFERWKENGKLNEIIEFITSCSRNLITQRDIAKRLGITEKSLSIMKKKHPEINDAIENGKLNLQKDLIAGMVKLALGYEEITETQDVTEIGKSKEQKKKVNRVKKAIGPNYKAIVYLLTKNFGKEYSDRYAELEIMEKRLMSQKEEWNSEPTKNSDDEN